MKYMKTKTVFAVAALSSKLCVNGAYLMPDMKTQSAYRAAFDLCATGIKVFSKFMAALLYIALVLSATHSMVMAQTPKPTFDLDLGTWEDPGNPCGFCDYSIPGELVVKTDDDIVIKGGTTTWRIVVDGVDAKITLNNASISTTGNSPITINSSSELTLTLTGNNTLTADGNFAGIGNSGVLTIPTSTGGLTVNGGSNGAGIGGGQGAGGGTINIGGGTINATGGINGGAGIGGGQGADGDNITITGGTINATGGVNGGAGIGGGQNGDGGDIEITGGTINANGGLYGGAGIGGGAGGDGGDIEITGGTINANGGETGAGIGGGQNGDGGDIKVTGGTINAEGGSNGAGIGGGQSGDGGSILITGGMVGAKGGSLGAGIGGGQNGDSGTIGINGGYVEAMAGSPSAMGVGYGYGLMTGAGITMNRHAVVIASSVSVTGSLASGILFIENIGYMYTDASLNHEIDLTDDASFPDGGEITVASYQELVIPAGVTLTNYSKISIAGKITIEGELINYGEIINSGEIEIATGGALTNTVDGIIENDGVITIYGNLINEGAITNNVGGITDITIGGELINTADGLITNDGTITIDGRLTNDGTIYDNGVIHGVITGNPPAIQMEYIYLDEPNNSMGYRWIYSGNVYTILDGAYVTISGISNNRRFQVDPNATVDITLNNVLLQSTNAPPLSLNAGANVTLTLLGNNTLSPTGTAANVAGINVPFGATMTITAESKGGVLTLSGGGNGAGIGGVDRAGSGSIFIDGGVINATAANGAAIGGGRYGAGDTIVVNGGVVTATSTSGAGVGNGYGALAPIIFAMDGNAVVFASSVSDTSANMIVKGIIFIGYSGTVYGNVTLEDDLTIPVGYTLTVPTGVTLTNHAGNTVFNYGTIRIEGALINNGTITCDGAIIGAITGNNSCGANPPDPTLPAVLSVTPVGANASTSGSLMIVFSKAMDTTPGTVQLNNTTLPGGIWINNTVFSIPYNGLTYGTQYTVNISGFRDTLNNTMAVSGSNSFTTAATQDAAAPTIVSVTPAGTNVSAGGSLVITFNKAMNTTPGTVQLNNSAVTGGAWSNGNTVFTIPYSGLTPGVSYAVYISGFRDTSGNTMAPCGHGFTTGNTPDTIPPVVLSVTPGGTDAPLSGNLVITFSEAMDSTIFGTVRLNSLTALTGGSWSGGNTVFTIPYSDLTYNTLHTVNVSDFKDAAGNAMTASGGNSFTTVSAPDTAAPTVLSVTPDGTGAPTSGSLVITFSKAMDTATNGTVRLDSFIALTGGAWSSGNTVFTIPYRDLSYGRLYTVNISGFKDASGNVMAVSDNYGFSTGTAPILSNIPRLALGVNQQGPIFADVSGLDFKITNDGNGHFAATVTGRTDNLTIYGVQYVFEYVPEDQRPFLIIEKEGTETPVLDVHGVASTPGLYYSASGVTFNHGDRVVYKLYIGDVFAGSFTVIYINEPRVIARNVTQVKGSRGYWFDPVELYGTDYRYEIISRANILGGMAPWMDFDGQFAFGHQVMPVNISRAGVYMVKAVHKRNRGIEVFRIEVN